MNNKYLNYKWILYQEIANESNLNPEQETNKAVTGLSEMKIKTDDPETNKHVPFIIETEDGYDVKVGKNGYHTTDSEHHTMFIDLVIDDVYQYRQYILEDELSEASFKIPKGKKSIEAFAFCNLHGMWTYKLK